MKEEVYHITQKSESKSLIRFSLAGTTFPDKSYRIHRPVSYTACIEFVEEGRGTVSLDGEIFHPEAGDSYFLQSRRHHLYFSDKDTPWKKHFINVSGRLLESLAEGYGLSHVSYFKGLDLKKELLEMVALAKAEGDPTEEMIGILNEIFFKMRRHTQSHANPSPAERMKDFLNAHVTEKFEIGQLCAHLGKSESQTIRLFKEAYGVTPYRYLLDKKISLAKKLLSDTALTVAQVAEKLAFSDEYYFSGLFKAKVGVSPSLFRKASK